MKFIPVDKIPEKKWDKPYRKDIKTMLDDFMASDDTMVQVQTEPGEYASTESVSAVVTASINCAGYSNLKVRKRGNEVYIEKEI